MTTLLLRRVASGICGTFGVLIMDGYPICVTCEDPWNDNAPNDSCIPLGRYHCIPHNGPRFQNVWEIANVPGRSAILIHSGNSIADTHGCVLLGDSFDKVDGLPGIINSVATLTRLRKLLPSQFDLVVT